MLSEDFEKMMITYLASLPGGENIRQSDDLANFSAHELLLLSREVDDSALGLFVQLLKRASHNNVSLFEKLMGEHEEENRELVDNFFTRYMETVLSNTLLEDINPLECFLPQSAFADLAFVQSRQAFFLRQTIETINAYLRKMFPENPYFVSGEQEIAWKYFWQKIIER